MRISIISETYSPFQNVNLIATKSNSFYLSDSCDPKMRLQLYLKTEWDCTIKMNLNLKIAGKIKWNVIDEIIRNVFLLECKNHSSLAIQKFWIRCGKVPKYNLYQKLKLPSIVVQRNQYFYGLSKTPTLEDFIAHWHSSNIYHWYNFLNYNQIALEI